MKSKPMFLVECFFWKQIPNLLFSCKHTATSRSSESVFDESKSILWKTTLPLSELSIFLCLPLVVVKILCKYLPNKSNYPPAIFYLLSYQRKIGFFLLLVFVHFLFSVLMLIYSFIYADFLSTFYVPSLNKQQTWQTSPCSHGANVWAWKMDNREITDQL